MWQPVGRDRASFLACCLWFLVVVPMIGEGAAPAGTGFDGAALQRELSQPVLELHRQGPEALRLHVQGLAAHDSALDTAQGVSPEERAPWETASWPGWPRRVFSFAPTARVRPGPTRLKATSGVRRR